MSIANAAAVRLFGTDFLRCGLIWMVEAHVGSSKPSSKRDLACRDCVDEIYSISLLRKSSKLLRILLVPCTTQHNGSSAMHTGSPVSSRIRLSMFFSKAPPPASTMPRSMMSAESSGEVRSSATLIALTMVETHSLNAPRISLSSTVTVFWHSLDEAPAFDLHG